MKAVSLVLALCLLIEGSICEEQGYELAHHHNYEDMVNVMEKVHEKCPDVTKLYHLEGNPDHTVQGRKLMVLIISDKPETHELGKF